LRASKKRGESMARNSGAVFAASLSEGERRTVGKATPYNLCILLRTAKSETTDIIYMYTQHGLNYLTEVHPVRVNR
jgi:hypothetical protein